MDVFSDSAEQGECECCFKGHVCLMASVEASGWWHIWDIEEVFEEICAVFDRSRVSPEVDEVALSLVCYRTMCAE